MSIYSGTPIEQAYSEGNEKGYTRGAADVDLMLGLTSEYLRAAEEDAETASTRRERAFALGYLRGYREAVRSYADGRWGL